MNNKRTYQKLLGLVHQLGSPGNGQSVVSHSAALGSFPFYIFISFIFFWCFRSLYYNSCHLFIWRNSFVMA